MNHTREHSQYGDPGGWCVHVHVSPPRKSKLLRIKKMTKKPRNRKTICTC